MTSTTSTLNRGPQLHMRIVMAALPCMITMALAVLALGVLDGSTGSTGAVGTAPAPTPTPVLAPLPGDGVADHALFNPSALLDTRQIDDLRADRDVECLAGFGVMTPAGECVDAIAVWKDEVDPGVWAYLQEQGYDWSIDHSEPGAPALLIPAEMVILGGAGGEQVLSVDPSRPLTPRA